MIAPLRRRRPTQIVVLAFAFAILLGAALLMLPVASVGPGRASILDAVFTATSAVCVTGLIVVDTATFWSGFGQSVILALIQIGGFGIMAAASLLALSISRRFGFGARVHAAAELKGIEVGDIRSTLFAVARTSILIECIVAVVLVARLWLAYEVAFGESLWLGLFHSVSAFNNAGFSLYSDNLIGFATDPWVSLTVAIAVILGGIGFPVLFELRRELGSAVKWSVHTKVTLLMTGLLLVGGWAAISALEWSNVETLGGMDTPGKLLASFFQSVTPRTAGFNTLDIGAMNPETWVVMDVLMFIGGGSASTAGGIKITTFAVLLFVIIAEVRGDREVSAFRRSLPTLVQRQALTVALSAVAVVVASTLALLVVAPFSLDQILFEVISAFATVGLSTGITALLPTAGQVILIILMFAGRLGPVTLAAALALRHRARMFGYPEEIPVIG